MIATIPIVKDVVVVMLASAASVYLLRNARVPSVVGFLFAGLLVGPSALGLVTDRASVEVLAEIGVVFLLFTIGLKFSVTELIRLRRLVFGAGTLQMVATMAVVLVVCATLDVSTAQGVFLGALVAMSSTAIVLKLMEERGDIVTPHGRLMVSILILQDIAVVPLMLLIPLLGGGGDQSWGDALLTLGRSVGLLALIFVTTRFLFPWILERVVGTRSRELFTLTTLLGALGTAWVCSLAGVSLPLGAFLAGIVIPESPYAHQTLSEVIPMRDAFASLFFVSVGMLVDPSTWVADPALVLGLVGGVIVVKALVVGGIAVLFGFGPRIAVLAGLGLAQVGEFSLILMPVGVAGGLMETGLQQTFLSVAVLTMGLTPVAVLLAQRLVRPGQRMAWLASYLARRGPRGKGREGGATDAEPEASAALTDHVIIVGYGINGRNVARVLQQIGVSYLILELNPQTVRDVRTQGDRIQYGDATQQEVLEHALVHQARAVVVAIADAAATRQIVVLARRINPDLRIIVRTRLVGEVRSLLDLGADDVVPEEFETSLELAGTVMTTYGVGPAAVLREKNVLREEHYEMLRSSGPPARQRVLSLAVLMNMADLQYVRIPDGAQVAGRSLRDLELRNRTGGMLLSVEREGETLVNPDADFVLREQDVVTVFGRIPEIEAATAILTARGAAEHA